MIQNPALSEMVLRLEHLRKIPSTPMRVREIASLERVIANWVEPESDVARKRSNRSARRDEEQETIEEDDGPTAPLREVKDCGTHRSVHIRKKKAGLQTEEDDEVAFQKEQKERMNNIQLALGMKYRY